MSAMAEMIARYTAPGRIDAIYLRPERRLDPVLVSSAEIIDTGLDGDHGRAGKRAVTLIQAEHIPAIRALSQNPIVDPGILRRNIVVSGINLAALRNRQVKIGSAIVEFTVPCHPCSRMEELLGHGGYSAMRGHGGFCAGVITGGAIAVGDVITPLEP
ncbi:MOSC domain-containing protein [Rhodobacteraceae bacterium]|nr:MOSC domain-containing protein [Paracoccaceae bacterium]